MKNEVDGTTFKEIIKEAVNNTEVDQTTTKVVEYVNQKVSEFRDSTLHYYTWSRKVGG